MEPENKKRNISAEVTLGDNMKCIVKTGNFDGQFIRLMRGTRWIAFSHSQWRNIIKQDIEKEVYLKLSTEKNMKTIVFNDNRYVSFNRKYRLHQRIYETYIRLNQEEWKMLMQFNQVIVHLLKSCCTEEKKTDTQSYAGSQALITRTVGRLEN